MKALIYVILIVGFLMFYQSSPIYAFIILGIMFGLFIFFKRRKRNHIRSGFGFFSGKAEQQSQMQNLMTLSFINQLVESDASHLQYGHPITNHESNQNINSEGFIHQEKMERAKEMFMEKFDPSE
ncbi:MAG: hypothetical protein GF383_06860 [Candidatus Lokiarchaeota archaeon]|nr:hypothetical protein [Candidatus Lokiarchaeota archaeon]